MTRRRHEDHKAAATRHRSAEPPQAVAALPRESATAGAFGVFELSQENFASSIDGHPFAVIDICAPSSPLCRAFAPIFAAAAARNPDVLFARVDADAQQAMVQQFNITAIPTLIIFRSNVIVYAKAGALQAAELDEVLRVTRALDMDEVRRKVVGVDAVAPGVPAAPTAGADAQDAGDAQLSIEAHLRPSVRAALTSAGPRLAAGGLVAIRDAFEPDFAERMHRSLDSCTSWRVYEGYDEHFHYHHHNLYELGEFPPDIAWCSRIFDSPGTKRWVTRLSARSCVGPAEVSASWYLPGDHSLPHNDVAANDAHSNRQVAFVWHLAKDWRSEWGGALFWCANGCYLPPVFNTLWLFIVGPESTHFVTHVSPYAQGKRLAINGWWTGPGATTLPVWKGPDRIGTESTGIAVY
jgi:thioredoxin 1